MGWFPPDFVDSTDKVVKGDTENRYVLIDRQHELVWKVYVLALMGGNFGNNPRHYEREKRLNQRVLDNPHPNLRTIRNDGFLEVTENGSRYGVLKFDYLPRTLAGVIWEITINYTANDVLSAAFQLLEGLYHLHDVLDITHRDMKPDNILITGGGILKIADFNISREGTEGECNSGTGTLRYMNPAQLVSGQFRAEDDLFSTSIILWELAKRRHCLPERTAGQIIELYRDQKCKVPGLEGDHLIVRLITRCCRDNYTCRSTLEWARQCLEEERLTLKDRFETFPSETGTLCLPIGLESVRVIESNDDEMQMLLAGAGALEAQTQCTHFPMPNGSDIGFSLGNDVINNNNNNNPDDGPDVPKAVEPRTDRTEPSQIITADRRNLRTRLRNWAVQTFSCNPAARRDSAV